MIQWNYAARIRCA